MKTLVPLIRIKGNKQTEKINWLIVARAKEKYFRTAVRSARNRAFDKINSSLALTIKKQQLINRFTSFNPY